MVVDIYKEIADLETEESRRGWEDKLKKTVKELECEHKKGSAGAVFEMLSICFHDDREWYGNGAETECGWDYTRVPTWAVEASLSILAEYLVKWQSDGRGRNAKWLSRLDQSGDDFYYWFNVNANRIQHKISVEDACIKVSQDLGISPDAAKKAYFRHKNRAEDDQFNYFYQYVHFLRNRVRNS